MTFALFGGNSDNGAKVGALYAGVNDPVSDRTWNNGAALSYLINGIITKYTPSSSPLGENKLGNKHSLVTSRKRVRG